LVPNFLKVKTEEFGLIFMVDAHPHCPPHPLRPPKHIPLSFPVKLTNSIKIDFGGYGEHHDAMICTLDIFQKVAIRSIKCAKFWLWPVYRRGENYHNQ